MNGVQIQKSEGSQTTKLLAPRDGGPGEFFTFYGVPVVSQGRMERGRDAVFFKRATIEASARLIGLADPQRGPLLGNFVDIEDAYGEGWQELLRWAQAGDVGAIEIGIVENVKAGTRPINTSLVLSLSDGHSGGSSGGGDADLTELTGRVEDTEADVVRIDGEAETVRGRVTTLEGLIGEGGETDLTAVLDSIDDLQTQTLQLSGRLDVVEGDLSQIKRRGQAMIFKVVDKTGEPDTVDETFTIAPGETKLLYFTNAILPGFQVGNNAVGLASIQVTDDQTANNTPLNYLLSQQLVAMNDAGVYNLAIQLAVQPDQSGVNAGAPFYAGSALAVTVLKFDDQGVEIPSFPGKINQASGYWNGQRLEASIPMFVGQRLAIAVTNTNTGAEGDDQPIVLGPGACVIASYAGRL